MIKDLNLGVKTVRNFNIAIAGNPNSGKSTIFNSLTGMHQHTGNWPGVTVEKKEGKFCYNNHTINVIDLPGIYSLSAYSIDEKIARDYITREKPDLVVAVIDASNLERNLYLALQLQELGVNIVLDLNMMDLVSKKGIEIDTDKLASILGIPVIETIANKSKGIEDLKSTIINRIDVEKNRPFRINYGHAIEDEIQNITNKLEDQLLPDAYPLRWLILKLFEGDPAVLETISSYRWAKAIQEEIMLSTIQLEKRIGYDIQTVLAERRYGFIEGIIKECCSKKVSIEERIEVSDKIDKVVTNKFLGIPIFLFFLWLTFQAVFTIGAPFADLIDSFFGWLSESSTMLINKAGGPEWISSLISDGIIGGVGSVLIFLPNILILFLAIAILEDSGYMARAAFVMDRLMHMLGLHGKSFIPMIIGFGCNLPAIMATRTLESKKDRILTIMTIPLMSCSARLPIYVLFAGAFFPKHQGLILFSLYLIGIVLAVLVARLLKSIFFKAETAPLIMELPPYRVPRIKNILIHMWQRGSIFVKKAGTIIFAGVVIIWLLASFPIGVEYGSQESLIGKIGSFIAPIFKPAGFGDWISAVALIFGIVAKEIVVGTMGTLYSVEESGLKEVIQHNFTPLSAYAFMIMSLIYIPCIAVIAVIKRETNWRWTGVAVGYSFILGWLLATLIYQIGSLFMNKF